MEYVYGTKTFVESNYVQIFLNPNHNLIVNQISIPVFMMKLIKYVFQNQIVHHINLNQYVNKVA